MNDEQHAAALAWRADLRAQLTEALVVALAQEIEIEMLREQKEAAA